MLNIEISAEKLFSFMGLPITNGLLTSWIVVILLVIASYILSRNIRKVPKTFQNIVESGVEELVGMMQGVLHSRKKAEKFFPLIATIFTFVLISNWLGIFPGVGSIGFNEVSEGVTKFIPLTRSAAADLNFTLAIALISVVMVNILAIKELGAKIHFGKFFNFKGPIEFFVGILEILGEFAKVISFSFRLFGNVFAGEVLLIIMGALAPFLAPIPFLMLEIFVGFIQALVFSMLTLVFLSIAVEHEAH
ncbi:MAG: F0F1 ATP synthase subunit A [Candidatus Pacebacteria bacterium]|nr:F0F1 ATP synthase subunit A [Candidatus Paceibacterota bacterium]